GDLLIYNKFRKVTAAPDDTWTRQSWLISMKSTTTGLYAEWITRDYANYLDPPWSDDPEPSIRYIFPIPTLGIDNSKGVLKNDGYHFGF
ncbi:MAG TPA: hypothetical protein VJ346_03620, partial [Bacteroidales bacterium]|nr:hypothetical protein [Bacteroidales bacterium]